MGNRGWEGRHSNPMTPHLPFATFLFAAALVTCAPDVALAQAPPAAFVDAATVVPGLVTECATPVPTISPGG